MNNSINHFKSVGKVATGTSFIGRNLEMSQLRERVFGNPLANASIVGLPRIGKSSLMNKVFIEDADYIWESMHCISVWYTFIDYSDDSIESRPEDVFLDIIQDIERSLKKRGFQDPDVSEYARRASAQNIRFQGFKQEVKSFFDEITEVHGISIVICIDEFDYSKEVFSRAYFQLLRQISDDFPKVSIVTTSRRSILDIEKDSGGGSSFYETCLPIYLGPFSNEEVEQQRSLAGNLSEEDEELLDDACGNHPYLNALVLNQFCQGQDIETSIDESFQDVLSYYNRLFNRVLKKDHLDDKVINVYSGFLDAVSQDEEEYILKRYGLFKPVAQDDINSSSSVDTGMKQFDYVPFCKSFDEYMRQLYRKNPYKIVWPRAERSIKLIISKALESIHGPKHSSWYDHVETIVLSYYNQKHFNQLRNQMEDELVHYHENGSDNIVDQLYPKDFRPFIEEFWDCYIKAILGHDLVYWQERLDFIAGKVRNPESHSRLLLDEGTKQKATIICKEIIDCAEKAFGKID